MLSSAWWVLRNTGASPQSADTPSLSAGPEADGQEGSHLRTVLSSVERASLWKVMMILVGGRSVPYTSRVHLEKERDRKDFRDRADAKSWNRGHHWCLVGLPQLHSTM